MSGIRTSNNLNVASNLAVVFEDVGTRVDRGRFRFLPTSNLPSGGMFRAAGLCVAVSVPFWAGIIYLVTDLL